MLKKILLFISIFFAIGINISFAENYYDNQVNTSLYGTKANTSKNNELDTIKTNSVNNFYGVSNTGQKGLFNSMVTVARDMKNLFFAISTIFFLIVTLKILFAENSEEEFAHYKTAIVWITIGIIVMQISFFFVQTLFDKGSGQTLAYALANNIVEPLIRLLEFMASLFFMGAAIYSFIRLISAGGNEEIIKKGKYNILSALLGFLIVKFAREIIERVYGQWSCKSVFGGVIELCVKESNVAGFSKMFLNFINWANSFIAIATLIMIIYAGTQILLSAGDDEKLKKGKQTIVYALIGVFLLVINYLILTFFIIPETKI